MTLQKNDILAPVRERLLTEGQDHLAKVPPDLESEFKKHGSWAGAMGWAAAGAVLGAFAGSAVPEIGLFAAVPVAVVVGILGYFGGATAGSKIEKDK